jgi:hypothetical protein
MRNNLQFQTPPPKRQKNNSRKNKHLCNGMHLAPVLAVQPNRRNQMSYFSNTAFATEQFSPKDDYPLTLTDDNTDMDHILVHLEMDTEGFQALVADARHH